MSENSSPLNKCNNQNTVSFFLNIIFIEKEKHKDNADAFEISRKKFKNLILYQPLMTLPKMSNKKNVWFSSKTRIEKKNITRLFDQFKQYEKEHGHPTPTAEEKQKIICEPFFIKKKFIKLLETNDTTSKLKDNYFKEEFEKLTEKYNSWKDFSKVSEEDEKSQKTTKDEEEDENENETVTTSTAQTTSTTQYNQIIVKENLDVIAGTLFAKGNLIFLKNTQFIINSFKISDSEVENKTVNQLKPPKKLNEIQKEYREYLVNKYEKGEGVAGGIDTFQKFLDKYYNGQVFNNSEEAKTAIESEFKKLKEGLSKAAIQKITKVNQTGGVGEEKMVSTICNVIIDLEVYDSKIITPEILTASACLTTQGKIAKASKEVFDGAKDKIFTPVFNGINGLFKNDDKTTGGNKQKNMKTRKWLVKKQH
jgi:hypothetical protein